MPAKTKPLRKIRPAQHQNRQPGLQTKMEPPPESIKDSYQAAAKLTGRVALISGGDSGIGRAVAMAFAKEGADVAILYRNEHTDAKETARLIEEIGRRSLLIAGDIGNEAFCIRAVNKVAKEFGRLDILVNNAAEQHPTDSILHISGKQLERTFKTNIFAMFYLVKAALAYLPRGGSIINTTSVTAYRGSSHLLDYSATKGAIVTFTRSLAMQLVESGIRVNAVAPGPIWTPLIPATFKGKEVAKFGADVPMARAGEPSEVAPAFVFLASGDSSYFTGQVLHPNGGEIING